MFFNKYPYTDFHELNLDWVLEQIKSFETSLDALDVRVTAAEGDISSLKTRATSLEGRMTTAEGDISSLKTRATAVENRVSDAEDNITALKNADIQDAVVISNIGAIDLDAESTGFLYTKDTYVNGRKVSSEVDGRTLPPADSESAGWLLPRDYDKLQKMELSGSDMTFAGKVSSGSAPTSGSDLTNKTYVDSLAISGSATVGSDNNIYSTAPTTSLEGATFTPYGSARTYGKIAELNIGATLDYTSALHAGTTICTGTVKSALYPAWGSRWQGTARFSREAGRYEYVPVVLEFGQGGFFTMYCGQEATQSASTISINVRFTCIPHNA